MQQVFTSVLSSDYPRDKKTLLQSARNMRVSEDLIPSRLVTSQRLHFESKKVNFISQKPHKMFTFLCFLLVASACLPVASSVEKCHRKIGLHTFRYRNCIPQRRIAPICSGTCHSYTMTSRDDPATLQASCTCCQAADFIATSVPVRCPVAKPGGGKRFTQVKVPVRLPKTCRCRPCSFDVADPSSGETTLSPHRVGTLKQRYDDTMLMLPSENAPQKSLSLESGKETVFKEQLSSIEETSSEVPLISSTEESGEIPAPLISPNTEAESFKNPFSKNPFLQRPKKKLTLPSKQH